MPPAVVEKIRQTLGDRIKNLNIRSDRRVYIDIDAADLTYVARYLFNDLGARLATVSGMDTVKGFEVLYHFDFDSDNLIVSVRVLTPHDKAELDSITPIIKGADFIEREIHDLLGINFRNHPDLRPLILPDDWPAGVYPLRQRRANKGSETENA